MFDINHKIKLQELAYKWLNGTLSKTEQKEFDEWFIELNDEPLEIPFTVAGSETEHEQLLFSRIQKEIELTKQRKLYPLWLKIAAAVIITVSAGLIFYQINSNSNKNQEITYANDVAPGTNGATLTLSNGRKISIGQMKAGTIAELSGISITKNATGEIVYSVVNMRKISSKDTITNTFATSNGQQSQLILPDGTKVWLNASSSLRFPSSFFRCDHRNVQLSGEAYFEVSKDKAHPFIVKTAQQEVEVLGTHFNINAYKDEPVTKTTLFEGSVRIKTSNAQFKDQTVILKPNEQAIASKNDKVSVNHADQDMAVAWKDGEFRFRQESLESIMKKISRWYDVEVIYEDQSVKKELFGGTMSRFGKVSEVLKMLELTGSVHFKIEGRRIIVMK